MEISQTYINELRELIKADDLDTVLVRLGAWLDRRPLLDEIIQQTGRFEHIKKQIRLGTVNHAEATLTRDQIRNALIELLSEIEKQQSERPEEIQQAEQAVVHIANSKNVIDRSSISGNNVDIGDKTTIVHNHFGPPAAGIPDHFLTAKGANTPENFLGREDELAEIARRFQTQNKLLLVNAEGGMGKTSLAAAYWDRYEKEYRHVAWLFCDSGIVTAMENNLARPLGLEEIFKREDNAEKRATLLKTGLANLPKPCLLVLDNANDYGQIAAFMQIMAGLDCHVLFTSRCQNVLPGRDSEIKIESLPPDLAKKLFRDNYSEDSPEFEALMEKFLKAVGSNTLCIDIFSKNLRENQAWGGSMAGLVAHLENNGLYLGDQCFEINTDYSGTIRKSLKNSDEIIAALYDFAALNTVEETLLTQFALLPAENHIPEILKTLLSPDDAPGLKRTLDVLVKKGWLHSDIRTYRISPVVQKVVLDKHRAEVWEYGEPLVNRLIDLFETEGYHSKNINIAAPYAVLVMDMVELLKTENEEISILLDRLWVYFNATGDLVQALYSADIRFSLNKKFGNKHGMALSCQNLGITYSAMGNLPQGLSFFEEYNRLASELHEVFPQSQEFKYLLAISYEKLGSTHSSMGNLPQALTFFEEFNRLEIELHEAFPQDIKFKNGLAISCQYLGITYNLMGNSPQALTFFEEYNRLERELLEAFPQNVSFKNSLAISCQYLGKIYSAMGNLPQALTFLVEYNRLEKELHETFPQNVSFKNGLAVSCQYLGITYSAMGNLNQALTFFEEYNRLERELHEAFPQNVECKNLLAISCQYLGITYSTAGDLPQALTFFEEYNRLERELHEAFPQNVSFKNLLAVSCQYLGNTHTRMGNLPEALTFFEEYNRLEKELFEVFPQNVEFKTQLAVSSQFLGITYSAMGNFPQALTFFETYNRLQKELHEAFPQNVSFKNLLAISYQYLGKTHSRIGNLSQALTLFEAFNHLAKELHEVFPQNVEFKNLLAISCQYLGITYSGVGDVPQSLTFFEEYNRLEKELHEAFPQNVEFKNSLASSYSQLGIFYWDHQNDKQQARLFLEQARTLWNELAIAHPEYVEFQKNMNETKEKLKNL